jgi:diguanylate cyclase (GGDEF)-like protein
MPGNPFEGQNDLGATRDPLTRAANKGMFTEVLEREVAFATRHGRSISLVMCGVDPLDNGHGTQGNPAGDYVLQRVAETVMECVRTEDLVARVGGAEFAVLLRDVDLEGAFDCAERVRRLVQGTAFEHRGARIPVTVSVGVAALEDGAPLTPGELERRAEACLSAAKEAGRNCVRSKATPPWRPRAVGS